MRWNNVLPRVAPGTRGCDMRKSKPSEAYCILSGLLSIAMAVMATDADAKEPGAFINPESEGASVPEAEGASEPKAETPERASDEIPGTFSGSVLLTSNYVYRGVTNSDDNPAIQGTLEYRLETGLLGTSAYIGTFASNTELEGDTDTSNIEIDALFGIRGDIGDTGLKWDLGGAYYSYPGTRSADNFNYWEIPLILIYQATDLLEIELFNAVTPEYQFNTGIANYCRGTLSFDFPSPYVALNVYGGVGYQYVEKNVSGTDWILGTTATIKGVDFGIAYTDTNYSRGACGGTNDCSAKAVFTVGASF